MAEQDKQLYQSTTLGMPALRMTLVHARNEAQNAAAETTPLPAQEPTGERPAFPLDKEKAVRKIIEHLQAMDR